MKRRQKDQVIDYLATGKPLTPLVALHRYGILRLGARIWELREDGHKIKSSLVNRRGKTVAEYRLEGRN